MPSANLELVRSIYAAWERGDFGSAEWADPEIEFVIVDGPEPASMKGHAGMVEGIRGYLSAWHGFRLEADEFRQLDGERVLVLMHRSGRGKASGLEIGQMRSGQGAHLYYVREGKVTRWIAYFNRERALADLGLTPEEPHDSR